MAEQTGTKRRGWLTILLSVAALIALGFAAYALVVSWRIDRADDARRVRDLAIAAGNIESWPRSAALIGRSNLYHKVVMQGGHKDETAGRAKVWLYHPEFTDFQVEYLVPGKQKKPANAAKCDEKVTIADDQMSVRGVALSQDTVEDQAYYERLRNASWFLPNNAPTELICFVIADLDLKTVTAVPKGFEHLLLAQVSTGDKAAAASSASGTAIAGTGEQRMAAQTSAGQSAPASPSGGSLTVGVPAPRSPIVAQIGENRLPIRALSDLPDVEPELVDMARLVAQATSSGKAPALEAKRVRRDALQPLDSSVAGTSYRFYFYPVTLKGGGEYLLVGAVRQQTEAATFGRLGPRVLAFFIALAFLAALTPTIKLALLGPVDGIKPIEAGALVVGLLAAAALATTALVATYDVISVRKAVAERLSQSAAAIRTRTVNEIHRVLLDGEGSSIGALSQLLPRTARASAKPDNHPSLISWLDDSSPSLRDFDQPDSLFPIARNGQQAKGMALAVARDMSGTGFDLSDRPYFRRAVSGDFAPRSGELVAKISEKNLTGLWGCADGGLVFEQVRSRPDGVDKTIVATQVRPDCLPRFASGDDPDERRDGVQVLGVSMVLKSLLSPPLHELEQFAVLDASEGVAVLPVRAHSERGRAGIERFAEALNAQAKRGFASVAATRPECAKDAALAGLSDSSTVETFGGKYEGDQTLFAAARMPCTDWIVVTFQSRDLVDGYATQAATHALAIWIGLLVLGILILVSVNLIKRAKTKRPAWLWLWPDPNMRTRYGRAVRVLGLVAILTVLLAFYGKPPGLAALVGPALAVAALFAALRVRRPFTRWARPVKRRAALLRSPRRTNCPRRNAPDVSMERRVGSTIALMVLCVSVLPIVGLSNDARAYFNAQQVGDDFAALRQASEQERRAIDAVALTYRKATRAAPLPPPPPWAATCPDLPTRKGALDTTKRFGLFGLKPDGQPCFNGVALPARQPESGLIAAMRRNTLSMDEHSLFGDPRDSDYPPWGKSPWFVFSILVLLLAGALAVAFRSALRGLFGFGVVLEAVPYPSLPVEASDKPDASVTNAGFSGWPARFVAVAAPDRIRRRLEDLADRSFDLLAETESNARADAVTVPIVKPATPRLVLFWNLETLMRNRDRRLRALAILERLTGEQGRGAGGHGFVIGVVSDLSPLDRLLQTYEREADDLQHLAPEKRHSRRAEHAGEREDVRWSRLFESFTTYTYCAEKRPKADTANLSRDEKRAIGVVEREVAYLPDHVVSAVILDGRQEPPLRPEDIANWAKGLKRSEPRAIVDYLRSQLIEHYQLAWSISSQAERLLLYRYAHDQFVNVGEAYALKSLVRRGLVVLDPVPRLMNESFAQFIRHAEEPKTLQRWEDKAEHGAWQKMRYPLMIALPFALGVVAVVAIRSGESVAALVPFVISVGPALVNFFNSSRRVSA